jgi:predicted O-methyltransferase YrrM
MGGGKIIAVDVNEDYCDETRKRIADLHLKNTGVKVVCADAITAIHSLEPFSIDLAFVDDKIDARHIKAELESLWSWYDPKAVQKMSLGGLICVHDVTHDDVASAVIGHQGYILNTALMHLHGGLGLIQIPVK